MSPYVVSATRDELLARRSQLLERCRMSEEELRRRADLMALSVEEADALQEIDEIDYLLG